MTTPLIPIRKLLNQSIPAIAAHRGASAYAPENTMAAYKLALEMGVVILEIDVQLSKDGIPVVIHDPVLDRTTNGNGRVDNKTLKELKELDIGGWFGQQFSGERLLTLDELLKWAKGKTNILIEIKTNPSKNRDVTLKVTDTIEHQDMLDYVEVFSFYHNVAKDVTQINPNVLTGVCYSADPVSHSSLAAKANANVIHPNFNFCSHNVVKDAHKNGIFVITWTINNIMDYYDAVKFGVDCIKTDFPDKLADLIHT